MFKMFKTKKRNSDGSTLMHCCTSNLGRVTKPQPADISRIQALYGAGSGLAVVNTMAGKTPGRQARKFSFDFYNSNF